MNININVVIKVVGIEYFEVVQSLLACSQFQGLYYRKKYFWICY